MCLPHGRNWDNRSLGIRQGAREEGAEDQPKREHMKRKKPKSIPMIVSCEPTLELKPIPVAVSCKPTPGPKFMPPVTLSYESTLDLKPIPVTVSTENAGEAGEGAVRRMTKAVRTAGAKKATAASAKVRTAKARPKRGPV